jgi:hypothetical protein
MNKTKIFEKLVEIQKTVWRGDDLIDQEDLFELQDQIANLTLEVSKDVGKAAEKWLSETFPWLYKLEVK